MVTTRKPALEQWSADVLEHRFQNGALLEEALTHTTYANEHPKARPNERLEFLGDSVVGVVIAQHIFQAYPELPEGELTKLRAAVVCEPSLAERSRHLGVGDRMRFGRGEAVSGRNRDSILADAFEAVVGALYLDGGLEVARRFIMRELAPVVTAARSGQIRVDYKTQLQERLQRDGSEAPQYRLQAEEGPDHQKRFQVGVWAHGDLLGTGWGHSKKEAEQEAARQALQEEHG